jgi:hypothetical protein
MSGELPHVESVFPSLVAAGYTSKSPKSRVYNCIAYAAGDETRKWAGFREAGYHWPEKAKEGYGLEALISAFAEIGYAACDSDALEPGCDKVALYVDQDGLWTHAAKQTEDGQWTSKLGNWEDIVHRTLDAVSGPDPAYGRVACLMKRPRESTTPNS